MAGYRPLLSQTQSTSGSVSPSTIPVAHLQHPPNRNIGSIYHHSMSMSNAPLVYPSATHPMHGTPSISLQQHHHHHHHQQHRHSMHHHQQHQQFQQHQQLLARHRHLVGNSTRHNNLLHHHGSASGTSGINMTTTIMPLNASK